MMKAVLIWYVLCKKTMQENNYPKLLKHILVSSNWLLVEQFTLATICGSALFHGSYSFGIVLYAFKEVST